MTEIRDKVPMEIPVYGMTCEHCVRRVTKVLEKLPGVAGVQVSLADSQAIFQYDPAQLGAYEAQAAIEEAGYSITPLPVEEVMQVFSESSQTEIEPTDISQKKQYKI